MSPLIAYIPNILSSLRIVLALLLPFAPQNWWIWLIIASGGTDFLDGWIARRWQVMSWQGAVLDAFADKFFMLIALVMVADTGVFSMAWLPAILARDLLVLLTASYTALIGEWQRFQEVKARIPGKITTACQFLLLTMALLLPNLVLWALAMAILTSSLAAFDYGLLFYRKILQQQGSEKNRKQ